MQKSNSSPWKYVKKLHICEQTCTYYDHCHGSDHNMEAMPWECHGNGSKKCRRTQSNMDSPQHREGRSQSLFNYCKFANLSTIKCKNVKMPHHSLYLVFEVLQKIVVTSFLFSIFQLVNSKVEYSSKLVQEIHRLNLHLLDKKNKAVISIIGKFHKFCDKIIFFLNFFVNITITGRQNIRLSSCVTQFYELSLLWWLNHGQPKYMALYGRSSQYGKSLYQSHMRDRYFG